MDPKTLWRTARIVIVDIETTGVDPFLDRIVEVAAIVAEGGAITRRWSSLVNPGRPIAAEATKIHGIDDASVADAPRFADVVGPLSEVIGESAIVGAYSAKFDKPFLAAEHVRAAGELPWWLAAKVEWIDPLPFVWVADRYKKGKKLSEACARRGIQLEDAHRATADAEATALLLLKMGGEQFENDLSMPDEIGDLLELQALYAAQQEADLRGYWFRNPSKSPRARAAAGATP